MIRRVAEKQRYRRALAEAGAHEGAGRDLRHFLQFSKADGAVAEFDRRPRAEIGRRLREQAGHRAARDRIVPMNAFRIKLFAGMGHGPSQTCEAGTMRTAPLPLVGRGWGWG